MYSISCVVPATNPHITRAPSYCPGWLSASWSAAIEPSEWPASTTRRGCEKRAVNRPVSWWVRWTASLRMNPFPEKLDEATA